MIYDKELMDEMLSLHETSVLVLENYKERITKLEQDVAELKKLLGHLED
jgi:hypothetical protein